LVLKPPKRLWRQIPAGRDIFCPESSRKTLHRWLNSENIPNGKNIRKPAGILGVPLNTISSLKNDLEHSEQSFPNTLSRLSSLSGFSEQYKRKTNAIRSMLDNIDRNLIEASIQTGEAIKNRKYVIKILFN
jgi:hypothetical protein